MRPDSFHSGLSVVAERFLAALHVIAGRRRRVAVEDCFEALYDSDPFAIEAPDKRARLAEILAACASAGLIEIPKGRDRGRPPLPRSLRLTGVDVPTGSFGRDYPWRADLAWVSELNLTAFEFETLRAIQAFLLDGGMSRTIVPHRERSLELFAHEKALDSLVSGRLFGPGRLSLDLLRCRWAPPPLAFSRVGPGSIALVIENAATYHSCVATARADGAIGVIVYGAGRAFVSSVAGMPTIPGIRAIAYAGDLDAAGLSIPHAADCAAAIHGVAAVRPAARLWRKLLACGRASPTTPVQEDVAVELCTWLPVDLRERAKVLLMEGKRIAQEAVGTEALHADAGWCDDLEGMPGEIRADRET